ncbi:hypothetical protein M0802_015871, partial [Mischocyttarus mexicanus]|jgi:hypothetical protein
MKIKI